MSHPLDRQPGEELAVWEARVDLVLARNDASRAAQAELEPAPARKTVFFVHVQVELPGDYYYAQTKEGWALIEARLRAVEGLTVATPVIAEVRKV